MTLTKFTSKIKLTGPRKNSEQIGLSLVLETKTCYCKEIMPPPKSMKRWADLYTIDHDLNDDESEVKNLHTFMFYFLWYFHFIIFMCRIYTRHMCLSVYILNFKVGCMFVKTTTIHHSSWNLEQLDHVVSCVCMFEHFRHKMLYIRQWVDHLSKHDVYNKLDK